MKNFKCPKCKNSISLKELFCFKRNHQTICSNCKAILSPKKIKSFNWGFGIGFSAVVIPAQIVLFYFNDFLMAAYVGLLGSIIGILFVSLYTYLTTAFEEI